MPRPARALTRDEPRRIALWAVPRSVSTAFERVFIARGDAHVLHEPFSHAYYHGPERRSGRFDRAVEPSPGHGFAAVAALVLADADAPIVFVKDMAYQARGVADPAAFHARLVNTFLIRDPAEALRSLHRLWPDFTEEEAGYASQARLFDLVTGELGQPGIVVDAADFRADPEGAMRRYCAAVGIPFVDHAMTWDPGRVEGWDAWARWHRDAERSTRIEPPGSTGDDEDGAGGGELPPRVAALVERCRPHYERLRGHRLTA